MVVDVKIWGEWHWAYNTNNWQGALRKVRDQIELALNDSGMSHDVTVQTGTNPSAPNPTNLYNSNNSDFWDQWLNDNNAYAEDSSILVFEDFGGATFSSALNWGTTTDGCMTLVGGKDLSSSKSVQSAGPGSSGHYHDVYNVMHELSHALDAPTGAKAIGRYYYLRFTGGYFRSPTHTMWNQDNVCGEHNEANHGVDTWVLDYTDCAQPYLTDQSP